MIKFGYFTNFDIFEFELTIVGKHKIYSFSETKFYNSHYLKLVWMFKKIT